MKKWIITVSILMVLALGLYLSGNKRSRTADKNQLADSNPAAPSATAALLPPPSVSATPENSVPSSTGKPQPSYGKDMPLDITKQKELNDKAELEKLKELNRAYTVKVERMMKTNEIASLRQSIAEDEQTLKKIEASGTDIEGYKFVEKNLQARKARLKKLLQ